MFACMTLLSITLTVGLTPLVIGHIECWGSLVFQITACMTPPKKMNGRVTIIPYFYYLCHAFRDEADLIGKHSSAEQAFNEFLALNADMKCHHEKLLKNARVS